MAPSGQTARWFVVQSAVHAATPSTPARSRVHELRGSRRDGAGSGADRQAIQRLPPPVRVHPVELHTEDIAHSLTIDAYRIAKRVGPGHPVTFEFRADRAGTFRYYCNLQIEDGCRQMHGELVVRPR
jgi:plastocyanin